MESESNKFEGRESKQPMSFEEAHLSALSSYLSGEWDPEQYKQYLSKAYGLIDEAKYRVPGKDITILADGEVEFEGKKRPRGDIWPSVPRLAQDLDRLERMIETVKSTGGVVPEVVQEHFNKIKQEHDQTEIAFERGKTWKTSLNRTSLEESFSAPTAPETISVKLTLRDGGDRLNASDWRVAILHSPDSVVEGGIKNITEIDEGLIIGIDASEGNETGGITYNGELELDPSAGIKRIKLSADDSGPDGGYTAMYEM
jgi:hypothetical protein